MAYTRVRRIFITLLDYTNIVENNEMCNCTGRLVTMEGQKFEIPEDASQTLPKRSPMDPIW